MVKHPPANPGDMGLVLGPGGSPGEGNGNPLQCSCLEKRSLVGYGEWSHKRVRHDLTTK